MTGSEDHGQSRVQSKAPLEAETGSLVAKMCTVCLTEIEEGVESCLCPSCRSTYHRDCWDELGGCATYGCDLMAEAPSAAQDHDAIQGWGDEKQCPRCHKTIKAAATKCRFCRTAFPSTAPMDQAELIEWERQQSNLKPTRVASIALLATSLLGFLAPILLVAGLPWVLINRAALARAGGVYTILAFFAVALSAFYTLIMIIVVF